MSKLEIAIVAHHEAGHAVLSRNLRLGVREVSIIPQDDSLGYVTHWPFPASFQPDVDNGTATEARVRKHIIVLLAGDAAEARFRRLTRRRQRPLNQDPGSDWYKAVDLAAYMTGSPKEAGAYLDWLLVKTREMIENEWTWAKITHVAETLIVERRLSGRRLGEVVRAHYEATIAPVFEQAQALVSRMRALEIQEAEG